MEPVDKRRDGAIIQEHGCLCRSLIKAGVDRERAITACEAFSIDLRPYVGTYLTIKIHGEKLR